MGVLRSAAHRRVEFRLPVWLRGVFIIAVHHAFVLGLGARHGGIVKLSVVRCVTVFACFTYLLRTQRVSKVTYLLTYLLRELRASSRSHRPAARCHSSFPWLGVILCRCFGAPACRVFPVSSRKLTLANLSFLPIIRSFVRSR